MRRKAKGLLAALLIALQSGAARAADDAFQFFEEEAKVVTASRRAQSISESPLAVDVVTAQEIEASGASDIWDLLRFRVGMDVLDGRSIDGNRAVVSARGIPHEFASNLLVLVDGRSVSSLNQGGVYWEQLPLSIQDIDRIEIVRGPNAALYGTGAGVGVVNILTKKPAGKASFEADARAGNIGSVQVFQAAESPALKGASLRVSHAFRQQDGFPRSAGSSVDDQMRKNVLNLRASAAWSKRTDMEFLAGGSRSSIGLASGRDQRGDFENAFAAARLTHRLSEDSVVEAFVSRGDASSSANGSVTVSDSRQVQHDAEALHRFSWIDDRLNTAYGASFRSVRLAAPGIYGSVHPRLEIHRGYLQQSAKLSEKASVQGAISLEGSNMAGVRPNYQIAAVAAPSPEHALRASYSVAYTLRDFVPVYGLLRPNASTVMVGNPDLTVPYKITSHEVGYHGSYLERRLQADVSLYYTRIDNFHQVRFQSFSFPTTTLKFQRYDDAIARGLEIRLKRRFAGERWVYANYTYERVTDEAGDGPYTTRSTPSHKLNVGGSAAIARGATASVDLGYKDAYFIEAVGGGAQSLVPAYWRLDARLAYALPWFSDAECYVAGRNLLKPSHTEFPNGVDVARTYAAGVSIKLGRRGPL